MKKMLVLLIMMLVMVPVVAFAANEAEVVIPYENDDLITESTDEETGVVTKKFPIYIKQSTEKEIKSVTVQITNKAEGITSVNFIGSDPYEVTKDGDKGTFAVGEGESGKSGKEFVIGYVEVTVNSAAEDCSFKYKSKIDGVKTGAFVSYLAFGAGALLIAGIYVSTKSKKKMYNI